MLKAKVGRKLYPMFRLDDGQIEIYAGKWVIRYHPAKGIYAYSCYWNRENIGHYIPVHLEDGKAVYDFGIHSCVPAYARQAMDALVENWGAL